MLLHQNNNDVISIRILNNFLEHTFFVNMFKTQGFHSSALHLAFSDGFALPCFVFCFSVFRHKSICSVAYSSVLV